MPASIIRLTALRPAPPTPTTRMTAMYAPESARGAACSTGGSGMLWSHWSALTRGSSSSREPLGLLDDRRRLEDGCLGHGLGVGSGSARPPAPARAPLGSAASSAKSGVYSTVSSSARRSCSEALVRLPPSPPPASAPPRLRGTARRAGRHACWRAFAPLRTSFARSRYASAAVPVGSYLRMLAPFTGASA